MKVDIYSTCWNEADMLEFFFEHYDSIASRYIIYDDGSTDGSLDIMHRHPKVEVRKFHRSVPDSYVLSAQHFHNTVWKESRGNADWVILTPIDEHLFHAELKNYLRVQLRVGTTIIPALGFQMISDHFPNSGKKLCDVLTVGAPFKNMNKLSIFHPDRIRQTNYSVGRHDADPQGSIVLPGKDEVLNLHYKYLDFDRLASRHKVLASGLGRKDRQYGFGHRYDFDEAQLRKDWDGFEILAVDIAAPGFDAASHNEDEPWWRCRKPPF